MAKKIGAVLIVDEISAGFRLNSGGAHLTLDLEPDIAVFSKAIGNGYSIGAVIGVRDVMTAAQDSFISSTNWSERVGFSAAIATINKHRKYNVAQHLIKIGGLVQDAWKTAAKKYDIDINISGIFPLSHFSFECDQPLVAKAFYVQEMLKHGFATLMKSLS